MALSLEDVDELSTDSDDEEYIPKGMILKKLLCTCVCVCVCSESSREETTPIKAHFAI